MSNIYDVLAWNTSITYKKNDIVYHITETKFYYSLIDNNYSSVADANQPTNSIDNQFWGGYIQDSNNDIKPHFIWSPSYNSSINPVPRIRLIQFGDGVSSRFRDGINNVLLTLDLVFENRNYNEAEAINHFLYARAGVESFLFLPPRPYNKRRRFICKNWSMSPTFYDNVNTRCSLEEVAY